MNAIQPMAGHRPVSVMTQQVITPVTTGEPWCVVRATATLLPCLLCILTRNMLLSAQLAIRMTLRVKVPITVEGVAQSNKIKIAAAGEVGVTEFLAVTFDG
jgi:hypothetical protein